MNPGDYKQFHSAWLNAHAMSSSNQVPADSVVMAVFDVLAEHSLQNVLGALQVHARKSRFAPTPADVLEIIGERTGSKHIGADEAWAIVLESFDEFSTVVMTKEIAEARGIAYELYQAGDKTGARMAFRDSYSRIVSTAPDPKWFVSAGFDGARRADAVQKAIELGRLPAGYADQYRIAAPTATVAGLIEQANRRSNKTALNKLQIIKTLLAEDEDPIAAREQERLAFEKHRATQLSEVSRRIGELH